MANAKDMSFMVKAKAKNINCFLKDFCRLSVLTLHCFIQA